ncbi:hypothetical protein ABIC83_002660 [Roseateles asaccharophilus]|uniref:DotD/TraH family lipoprotein n=1 Tax=Roseateles asaccharophilus TaxID=582607 RepID=UPI003839BB13
MKRYSAPLCALALAALAGCATAPAPALIERDPVDGLIAKNAAGVTQALRELSEASGSSRVVASQAAARQVAAPAPTPVPAQSIAARRSPMVVETEPAPANAPVAVLQAPAAQGASIIAGSSGVVASGGLLSAPPAGLERLITVRWTGELEQLLGRVAQEAGWQLGAPTGFRVVPVIISLSADNRSAFDLLRDIGAIAGTSADIVVNEKARTISVRYPQR